MKALVGLVSIGMVGWTVWHLTRPHIGAPSSSAGGVIDVVVGDQVCRPDGRAWSDPRSDAVIIVASAKCPACMTTKPFEEELYQYCLAHAIPVYFVLPERQDSDEWDRELTQSGRRVIRQKLTSFGVSRIPAILRVSGQGTVKYMSTGAVGRDRRDAVFAALTSGASVPTYELIAERDVASYARGPHIQILGLSEIGRREGIPYMDIPFGELGLRAKYELNSDEVTIVDCGTTLSAMDCQSAALTLVNLRFRKVMVAGLPKRVVRCGS